MIDMDARPAVDVALPDGKVIKALKICPEVFEFDMVVRAVGFANFFIEQTQVIDDFCGSTHS